MTVTNLACADHFKIHDSEDGRHHTHLHEKIFALEKENGALKEKVGELKKALETQGVTK